MKDLLPAFNECASIFLEKLRPLADGKKEVSMKEAFREIALDVISKVRSLKGLCIFKHIYINTLDCEAFHVQLCVAMDLIAGAVFIV